MADEQMTAVAKMQADIATAQDAQRRAEEALAAEVKAGKTRAAEAQGALDAVKSELAAATGKIAAMDEKIGALEAAKSKADADAAAALELAGKAEARAKLVEGVLSRDPEALRLVKIAGTAPIAGLQGGDGAPTGGAGGDLQAQWKAALARAGGDYVKARKDNPDLHAKLVPRQ